MVVFEELKNVVRNSDFTLGSSVDKLEKAIAQEADTKFAVGVGSGTDAIRLFESPRDWTRR